MAIEALRDTNAVEHLFAFYCCRLWRNAFVHSCCVSVGFCHGNETLGGLLCRAER